MTVVALFALTGCLAVHSESDRIVAADLAPQFPDIASLPPETPIALAPFPGATRVVSTTELHALAVRFHLASSPESAICIIRPVVPLYHARVLEAMQRSLPAARIEVLEISRQPAPEGNIEFPLSGLHAAAGSALWNGCVHFAGSRKFAIWARVRVLAATRRVVAKVDLPAGRPIAAADLQPVQREEFPSPGEFVQEVADAAGKWPRVAIRAGAAIRPNQLEAPKEIARGDPIIVEVHDGAASLRFEAIAEAAGAVGQTISVRNPVSQKTFRARVQAKGLATVDASVKVNP